MRTVKLLVAAVVGLLLPLAVVTPASAGGPTSALLVAPGSNAVGLYHSDPEYEKLSALVGAGPRSENSGIDQNAHAEGPFVTVTWMIHDVQVWRVDRIYYEADGGPWIHTTESLYRQTTGVWHRSADSDELMDLLEELKLTDGEYAGPVVPPALASERAAVGLSDSSGESKETSDGRGGQNEAVAAPSDSARSATDDGASGWWWAGGGLLAGLLLSGAAVWLYPIVRSPRPERQQLVDY